MTVSNLAGGKIYRIPAGDIEYVGYFYGANAGREDLKDARVRIGSLRGRVPDFLINCELFDFNTRRPASDVVASGKIHRLTESFGLAFPGNRYAVFSYKNNVSAPDYIGFYPHLIRGGKVDFASSPAGLSGSRGRTAVGVDPSGNLYLALVPDKSGGATLPEVAKGLLAAGATDGGNLDGGGSSQWYSPGGCTYTGRSLRGFVAVWLKPEPPVGQKRVQVRTALNIRKSAPNALGINLSPVVGTYRNGETVPVYEAKAGWWRTGRGWCYGFYLK